MTERIATEKTKPCPFCGGTQLYVTMEYHGYAFHATVVCQKCRATAGSASFGITRDEALTRAVRAWNVRCTPVQEPLSLEQLKQMSGEPVWFTRLDEDGGMRWAEWRLLLTQLDTIQGFKNESSEWIEDYGKTWLAYTRKPTDR